jgi:sulfur carrier protein ThiS
VSISGTTASVTYNGTTKTVSAGATLATGVSVVKVDPDTIIVSYNNKIYALTTGQTVTF